MPYKYPVKFGKYLLTKRIAVGGMAELFLAKMVGIKGFEKTLALKKILPEFGEDEEFVELFVDEAKMSVQLQHANIVQVFDFGEIDASHYIAMEFVDGPNLKNLLKRCLKKKGTFPAEISIHIALQVLKALDYAQRVTIGDKMLNLVHRDVSPQNVLISREGEVKITDFGIAKATIKLSKTQPGKIQGKFSYMSPEQSLGLEIDHRSDIFSLGIIFFEMLTGFKLYSGDDTTTKWARVREAKIPPPSEYNKGISRELETIVMRLLAKDPKDRYQTAQEVIKDLADYLYPSSTEMISASLASLVKELFPVPLSQEQEIPVGKILEVEKEKSTMTDFKLLKKEPDKARQEGPILVGKKKKSITRISINASPVRAKTGLLVKLGFIAAFIFLVILFIFRPGKTPHNGSDIGESPTTAPTFSPTPVSTSTEQAPAITPVPYASATVSLDQYYEEQLRKKQLEKENAGKKPPKQKEGGTIAKPKAVATPPPCPDDMAFIQKGDFAFGSNKNDSDFNFGEIEEQNVFVQSFCMDRYEFPNVVGALPRTDITFGEAKQLCQSKGKRLCSELEWEKACKGKESMKYPYGNAWNPSACNTQDRRGT